MTGASASRSPDHNGWYNHTLTVTFTGADATSGIDSCTQTTYSGPDNANASVSGSCRDRAGNQSASSAFTFHYDETGPQVTATPARAPDANGWYNHPLSVTFTGSDATSGIESCVPAQTYSGPDDANASVNGSCRDVAGNTTARSFALSYDATAPEVNATPDRPPDSNGWYNDPLTVTFTGSDATSGIESCDPPQTYSGPDTPDGWVSGSCRDVAGNQSAPSVLPFRYDKTPPTVTAAPARAPDANGWYNHPLTVSFTGADATSGIGSCTQATYAGPDNANASLGGSCRDVAGNQGAASAALRYDATPPTIGLLAVKAGKRSAELHWRVSPDTRSVELARSPGRKGAAETLVYAGPGAAAGHLDTGLHVGRTYRYRLTGSDEAANKATRTVDFRARGALLNPAPGERLSAPPLLTWTPVKGATYYNVVLVRGRRVYSAWPVRSRLQLPRAWDYRGRRQQLRPGLYRWYVWPGFGPLSAGRYGRLLGGSSFVVKP